MTEIEEHLSQLSPMWEGREITEESRIIDIDSPVSDFSEDALSGILQLPTRRELISTILK
ncbi:hypothetical protein [Halorussus caseinilyticus]|uniref:Uncharacterized protein n=1 Tax=Halorussus caseinilyticus TaxID=3034025 RepID=A0ABD5WJP7_9EURY